MSKLLTVLGATGQQGGSIIKTVLNDKTLSVMYKVRAVARDPSSEAAQALKQKGVEVIKADLNDPSTFPEAMEGTDTLFLFTSSFYEPDGKEKETAQGKALADAAVKAGVSYIIFSTLPHVGKLSKGKYTKVGSFDCKADIETYIRTLPVKSAFFAPGSFMQNWNTMMKPRPDPEHPGEYITIRHVSPSTQLPLIETATDTGKYVGAILADPGKYEGATFCSASKLYSLDDIARIMSEKTGKKIKYRQLSAEVVKGFFPPAVADVLMEMMSYQEEFGYYGEDTEAKVKWAVDNAYGKVLTFEEYLDNNPLSLD